MSRDFILQGKKVELGNIVFLKKTKFKNIPMDRKWVTIKFPRGKYGIIGMASNDDGVVTHLTLNPSLGNGSYGDEYNFEVRSNEVKVC